MSEDDAPTDESEVTPPAREDEQDWKAKYEDLLPQSRKWEQRAKDNAEARRRLDELEAEGKSEVQKLTDANSSLQTERDKAVQELARWKVGIAAGLPADVIGRIQGSTEDEMAADAKSLAELLKTATPQVAGPPSPRLQSGAQTSPPSDEIDPKKLAEKVLERRFG